MTLQLCVYIYHLVAVCVCVCVKHVSIQGRDVVYQFVYLIGTTMRMQYKLDVSGVHVFCTQQLAHIDVVHI